MQQRPHWLLRWGNVLLGGLILGFGIFASSVRFERKVHGKVSLHAEGGGQFSGQVLLPVTLREKVARSGTVVVYLPDRKVPAEITGIVETQSDRFVVLEIEVAESVTVPTNQVNVAVSLGSRTLIDYLKEKAAHD